MKTDFTICFVFAVALSAFGAETASAQMPTCSGAARTCAQLARNPALCEQARKSCLATGRFVGPESGKDFGPHIKK